MSSFTNILADVVTISPSAGSASITIPAGTDLLAISFNGIWADIGSITVGAASGVESAPLSSDGNTRAIQSWCVVSPPSGAQTIEFRRADGSSPLDYFVSIYALSGMDTASPIRNYGGVSPSGGDLIGTLTTVADDIVVGIVANDSALTPISGQTDAFNGANAALGGGYVACSAVKATGTSTNWSYGTSLISWSNSTVVVYKAASGGGGGSGKFRNYFSRR